MPHPPPPHTLPSHTHTHTHRLARVYTSCSRTHAPPTSRMDQPIGRPAAGSDARHVQPRSSLLGSTLFSLCNSCTLLEVVLPLHAEDFEFSAVATRPWPPDRGHPTVVEFVGARACAADDSREIWATAETSARGRATQPVGVCVCVCVWGEGRGAKKANVKAEPLTVRHAVCGAWLRRPSSGTGRRPSRDRRCTSARCLH